MAARLKWTQLVGRRSAAAAAGSLSKGTTISVDGGRVAFNQTGNLTVGNKIASVGEGGGELAAYAGTTTLTGDLSEYARGTINVDGGNLILKSNEA